MLWVSACNPPLNGLLRGDTAGNRSIAKATGIVVVEF
jgi:hypothetical protein